jgi:predicted metal-dependent hydrolase
MFPVISKIKNINVNGIGEIQITRSRRNKRLCISINKNKIVKVSIPLRVSFFEGERFVFEKLEWIKQTIQKLNTIELPPKIFDENSEFIIRSKKLTFISVLVPNFKMIIKNDEIQIICPHGSDLKSEKSQSIIKKFILEALRIEAKNYIPKRVAELAEIHNFKYNSVKIRNSKTRWGSCSYNNNINLSIHLIRLPDFFLDYVILHELVHTIHKNHSLKFWVLFDKLVEGAKEKSKYLKKYKLDPII